MPAAAPSARNVVVSGSIVRRNRNGALGVLPLGEYRLVPGNDSDLMLTRLDGSLVAPFTRREVDRLLACRAMRLATPARTVGSAR